MSRLGSLPPYFTSQTIMKISVLSLLATLLLASTSQAQSGFKLNIAAGFAKFQKAAKFSTSDQPKGGLVYSIEPQFGLGDNIDIGLRFEQAFIKRPEILDEVLLFQSQTQSMLSGALTLTYRIGNSSSVRPFVGVGAGMYYAGKSDQTFYDTMNSYSEYPLSGKAKLGGLGRVGVALGPVTLEGAYNLVSNSTVTNTVARLTLVGQNSYFTLKAGYTFGGRSR